MVTPEAPVSAVKSAQATKPTMASPAGIQPNNDRTTPISRSEVLAAAMM